MHPGRQRLDRHRECAYSRPVPGLQAAASRDGSRPDGGSAEMRPTRCIASMAARNAAPADAEMNFGNYSKQP
jgi:hypothetical protein